MRSLEPVRVEVAGCAKSYAKGVRALHPCELSLKPGEILALLGPSGCGKTTLLRLVAGLDAPDPGGRVYFGGEDVTGLPVEARGVGMVFQHYALFPHLSVRDNIGYGLRLRRVSGQERSHAIGELVELMHLGGLEERKPSELSGGQKQRVALARALAIKPRVLLLDEPLTALDAKLKESLRDELAALLRRLGITTLHVTHDQQETMVIADRLAVMHQGRIVGTGTAEELYDRPGHGFVAEFLGRVNRIERSGEDAKRGVLYLGGAMLSCPDPLSGETALLLRPEDIAVQAEREPLAPSAVILHRSFLGDRFQLRLELAGGPELFCYASKPCSLRVGDTVSLVIDPNRLLPARTV